MNFDELQKQWQSQQGGFKLRIDADVLLKEVQRNKERNLDIVQGFSKGGNLSALRSDDKSITIFHSLHS